MWQRIRALIIKELLILWRDKKSRFALLIPPIIQLFILVSAATLDVSNISIAVYNQDSGWYSHELVQRVKGSKYFPNVYEVDNIEEVQEAINTNKVLLAMNIQQDFSRKVAAGKSAPVQILFDGRRSNSAQIIEGYLNQIVQNYNADILKQQGKAYTIPVIDEPRAWFNPNLIYVFYNVPCIVAILSMLTALTVTSLSVARERELGTMDQVLVSPLLTRELLIGKTVPAFIVSMGESTLLMLIATTVFQVPFAGSFILFWFSMAVFVLAMIGVGLFISSLSQTQQQATLGIFIFMVLTMLLSGYATPVENMVPWLKPISWLIPITHFFIIAKGIFLKAMTFAEVLQHIWPIILVGSFNLLLAAWFFKRKLQATSG